MQNLLGRTTNTYIPPGSPTFKSQVRAFWEKIKSSADTLGMSGLVPAEYERMNETVN
jgi:hypothetical protein